MSFTNFLSLLRRVCCCFVSEPNIDANEKNVNPKTKSEMMSFENPLFDIDDFEIITPSYINDINNELGNTKDDLYIPENNN